MTVERLVRMSFPVYEVDEVVSVSRNATLWQALWVVQTKRGCEPGASEDPPLYNIPSVCGAVL